MRRSRIFALILCLALLVSAASAIAVSAADDGKIAKIGLANIEYGDRMYMSFTVEALEGETLPEKVGIAAYSTADLSGKPLHVTFEEKVDKGGTEYFASLGIPAKEISRNVTRFPVMEPRVLNTWAITAPASISAIRRE